jgi:uncharacterized membrane protein
MMPHVAPVAKMAIPGVSVPDTCRDRSGRVSKQMSESAARYEDRAEAAPVVVMVPLFLAGLALVSWAEEWEFLGLAWWAWLVLAVPALLLAVDLWLGPRGLGLARTRTAGLVLLGVTVVGNVAGLVVLVAALVTAQGEDLGGGQLLFSAAAIWATNVFVFGLCFWELDGGGPAERARGRPLPDFQFPQDQTPDLAPEGWRPRVWDYLHTSLSTATAFSATDAMPMTLRAKALMGFEAVVSLVVVVLVTARAVNVLGT